MHALDFSYTSGFTVFHWMFGSCSSSVESILAGWAVDKFSIDFRSVYDRISPGERSVDMRWISIGLRELFTGWAIGRFGIDPPVIFFRVLSRVDRCSKDVRYMFDSIFDR